MVYTRMNPFVSSVVHLPSNKFTEKNYGSDRLFLNSCVCITVIVIPAQLRSYRAGVFPLSAHGATTFSWNKHVDCGDSDYLGGGLETCIWQGPAPCFGTSAVRPQDWISVNVSNTSPGIGELAVRGENARN